MKARARRSLLVALGLAACAGHDPSPALAQPEEPPPPLAEWDGPNIPDAAVKAFEALQASAYAQGEREALAALGRGELALQTFGPPPACRERYARLLWRRHRIEHRALTDCATADEQRMRVHGFNKIMEAEIGRRFGADALATAARKAGCR
ncbi:hypothetical protein [Nannocystis exedens]|uniref:hypothetical protein n=1 Tax=Nannocystis exedens TaxID=54 RepID=UPI000C2B3A4A|nr:hypothetical protein [Nannocystis exedens]